MTRRSKYTKEFRERAVRRVFEWRATRRVKTGGVADVASQLGVNPETLRSWVNRSEVETSRSHGTTPRDKSRIAQLERENRELRRANEILKAASAFSLRELDPRPPM